MYAFHKSGIVAAEEVKKEISGITFWSTLADGEYSIFGSEFLTLKPHLLEIKEKPFWNRQLNSQSFSGQLWKALYPTHTSDRKLIHKNPIRTDLEVILGEKTVEQIWQALQRDNDEDPTNEWICRIAF